MAIIEPKDINRTRQAETKARDLLKRQSFSINDLIQEVEKLGFTYDEAGKGVQTLIEKEINEKRDGRQRVGKIIRSN